MQKRFFLKVMLLKLLASLGLASVALAAPPISERDVEAAQAAWGKGIVEIGRIYQSKGDYRVEAGRLIDALYGYGDGKVLFKPTKAEQDQFRETRDEALSYFVGGGNREDHGFAIQPWSKVRFENNQTVIDSDSAEAMGNYFFTDAKTGQEVKVEYTFGYKRGKDGHLVIFLHHSSLPFHPQH